MRFCACLTIFGLLLLCSAAAQFTSSPVPQPGMGSSIGSSDTQRYTLSGTVVNSVTNEPIRRALVTLFYQQQVAVMTDSDGRFDFNDLPRMSVTIAAQKPGYFSEQELSSGRRRPKQFAVGPDASSAVIKLVPEAIIAGRILDPDGLPIPELMVRAVTQRVIEGRKQWTQNMSARTDADGNYRISNLMPSAYLVIAGPGHTRAFVANVEDTSELGYPAIVYPGSSPMRINPGQQVEADFAITPEPFYSVTGSVGNTAPGNQYFVQLVPRIPGPSMGGIGGGRVDPESGTFTLPRVVRGDYTLQARGSIQPRQRSDVTPNQLFGSVPISVRGNLMGVTIPLQPTLTIPINVRVERTKEQKVPVPGRVQSVQVRLISDDQERSTAYSTFEDPKDPNSPLVLKNALPGKYGIELQPTFGDLYVAAARFGTTDLLNGDITLTSNANQGAIDVVLRDDGAHLRIKVPGEADQPMTLITVPDRGQPFIQDATGKSETQLFTRLRPGSYTVLAFEDIGNLEYTNRNALEPYLSRGVRVTLAPNQESTISPELIKAVSE